MFLGKRHISFFLLCLVAVPTLVSMVSSCYIQWIKHEMKEKMEYENLQTITLNNNEVSWYEKGNEIKRKVELIRD